MNGIGSSLQTKGKIYLRDSLRTDSKAISIPDLLKQGKYDGSIITTYNAFLPYYEEVVLRKLQSSGCRNNVLLMDARKLKECLNTPSLRPRLAGFEYTLLPITSSGAFHPKIICLLGEKKGCALVGSHNLTISGFNKNRELTTKVRFTSLKDRDAVIFTTKVWHFIRSWVEQQSDTVPEQIVDIVLRITNLSPWLKESQGSEISDFQFLGATIDGVSLYEQFLAKVPHHAKRIIVIGPFFDEKLEFIKRLKDDFSPKELIVGIDPSTVDIPFLPDVTSEIRFVNASVLGYNDSYLHAKIIYLETESKNYQLVTGSANPSSPAWLAGSNRKNIEAVVLHSGEIARQIAIELGLSELEHAKDITQKDWDGIAHRVNEQAKVKSQPGKLIIATVEIGGIVFDVNAFSTDTFKQADLYDENAHNISTIFQLEKLPNKLLIPVTEEDLRKVRIVRISDIFEQVLTTWVHHTADLSRRCESSRQAKFRTAMASLETDDPELPKLINIVEKIIFDEHHEVDFKAFKRPTGNTKSKDNIDKNVKLSISLDEIQRKNSSRRRIVNSGDLGLIMDVLIHNLGIGLRSHGPGIYSDGRDEEDMVGSDDEESPENSNVLSNQEIVKICNGKVRTIVTRMLKQFDMAKKQKYYKPLIQLVTVLALFRQLRKFESANTAFSIHESLVPQKDRERLLFGALPYLYGEKFRFIERAEAELVDEPIDEISRLKGLLLWLGKDVGVDMRQGGERPLGIDYSALRFESVARARAIVSASIGVTDEVSFDEAKKSIYQTSNDLEKADDWLEIHRKWGLKFSAYIQKLKEGKRGGKKTPKIGDLVFLNRPGYDFFHVVYSPVDYHGMVKLVGIEGEEQIIAHSVEKLTFFSFPMIQ
jgi:hypothetical protein